MPHICACNAPFMWHSLVMPIALHARSALQTFEICGGLVAEEMSDARSCQVYCANF